MVMGQVEGKQSLKRTRREWVGSGRPEIEIVREGRETSGEVSRGGSHRALHEGALGQPSFLLCSAAGRPAAEG